MLKDPQDVPHAFVEAWMARDAAALAALFAEDADFVNVTGLWWRDRAAIEKAYAYGLSTFFRETTLTPRRIETRRVGSDAAVVHCRFRLEGQIAPDGGVAGPRMTILSFVLERRRDGWIVVSAQNTDIVPGKETHVAGADGLTAHDYRRRT
ncbi:MAG: SgcJ/EcaC family oxidoreductase [Rubricella sp.]